MFQVYYTMVNGSDRYWAGDDNWSNDARMAKLVPEAEAAQLADDLRCEFAKVEMTRLNTPAVGAVLFVLIQGDKVLDRSCTPNFLRLHKLRPYDGFKIALGCINERGDREIIGIVADVAPVPRDTPWRISSVSDGNYRLINSAENPATLVTQRLGVMQGQGWFSDLAALPLPVVLRGNTQPAEHGTQG